ncbi:glutamate carboxypeptidase 2 isoform X1 [Hydra vulgaris]|uniref:glutamate carboxypeptidase 2 isoform X1 n=1 Tax=Hydra vulgaris TaxID=6087 RepID=UPI001F5F6AF4|nr:glutamate carboxypeptidase 2-like [Hydra vulgaris]
MKFNFNVFSYTKKTRSQIIIRAFVSLACLVIGIWIGYAIGKNKTPPITKLPSVAKLSRAQETERIIHHRIITDSMSNMKIRDNLKYLTELPHLPGSERNKVLGQEIAKQWEESGFDKVDEYKYNIYLPSPNKPGVIYALNEDGSVEKNITINNEPAFFDSEKKGDVVYPFNAFGTSGEVIAPIVYCNYGEQKDFAELEKLNISLKGKILLFRYGKASRSAKVLQTELRGGVAAIIFSDPYENSKPGDIYPNGFTGNNYSIQRGTANRINGDSLSEGYPSKDGYFRLSEAKYNTLSNVKIPSQPISEDHANQLFRYFKDDSVPVPASFIGKLPKYVLQSGRNFSLLTDIKFETKSSYTYCGTIYGEIEPDRYVLLGNHRDAWIYGAADPSSGTAAIMEIGRALGSYKKEKNWRPQRSIKICSWGAEEPGVLGSYEWADEHRQFLMNNVVLYINVDMAVEGNFSVRLRALDYYAKNVFDASKNLASADNPNKTLYQDWIEKSAQLLKKPLSDVKEPKNDMITSGSDYKALWHLYGVASGDFRYYFSRIDYPLLSQNAQYHTRYESFDWMTKFVDPNFKYHLTIGRLMLGSALLASDKIIVPLFVVDYVNQVKFFLNKFNQSYATILSKQGISLDFAKAKSEELLRKAERFQSYVDSLSEKDLSNPYVVRKINDKIIHFEKNFLVQNLIRRVGVAHVVYADTSFKLKDEKFPGIGEAIYFASKNTTDDWDSVRKQITMLVWCFDTANISLDLDIVK